jgi:SAM-dependent methyltransferase
LSAPAVFDQQHYDLLNRTRGDVVRALLGELKGPLGLHTAIDVGCGLGYFSGFLRSLGFDVTAVDGRQQNVAEAQRRNPDVRFFRFDAEDPAMKSLGKFDVVFCFGLLYHLENPFLTIRHLHAMTEKLLLVESVTFPGSLPLMALVDEGRTEDQGLNHIAFYPTEACLTKMLYRAGFPVVYEFSIKPEHPDFLSAGSKGPSRTMLAASLNSIGAKCIRPVAEPKLPYDSWNSSEQETGPLLKVGRFVKKSFPEKIKSIKRAVKGK